MTHNTTGPVKVLGMMKQKVDGKYQCRILTFR